MPALTQVTGFLTFASRHNQTNLVEDDSTPWEFENESSDDESNGSLRWFIDDVDDDFNYDDDDDDDDSWDDGSSTCESGDELSEGGTSAGLD